MDQVGATSLHGLVPAIRTYGLFILPPFFMVKGEVSWPETPIFDVDNQLELKKLCEFKKKSK